MLCIPGACPNVMIDPASCLTTKVSDDDVLRGGLSDQGTSYGELGWKLKSYVVGIIASYYYY